jgi:quercetin dioxygenase-like cupin family protein
MPEQNQLTPSDHSLDDVEAMMLSGPQAPYEITHHFGPNLYIREAAIPAGTIVLGHAHRDEHICIILKGKMAALMGDEVVVIEAPATFVAGAGRKMAYIMEDLLIQNVFSTSETDIDKLEDMLVDKTDLAKAYEVQAEIEMFMAMIECVS